MGPKKEVGLFWLPVLYWKQFAWAMFFCFFFYFLNPEEGPVVAAVGAGIMTVFTGVPIAFFYTFLASIILKD